MLDICATVWEGEDYLPRYFDRWVAVPESAGGQFTALELEGRVVALAKFSRLAPGEYWLEGIRVHADYRGQGLAAALHDYHLALWQQAGEPGVLRLLTGDPAIIKLCDRTGFRRLFGHRFAEAPADACPHAFRPMTLADFERAWATVGPSAAWTEWQGLCDLGWKWRTLTPEFFRERLAAGAAYQWRNGEAVLLTRATQHDDEDPGDFLLLQFPAVRAAQRWSFLAEVRGLAHQLGKPRVLWSIPVELSADLPQAGYTLSWAETETCFEARQ